MFQKFILTHIKIHAQKRKEVVRGKYCFLFRAIN